MWKRRNGPFHDSSIVARREGGWKRSKKIGNRSRALEPFRVTYPLNNTICILVDELERKLASARKDSSNSSKPPCSDTVKRYCQGAHGQRRRKAERRAETGRPKRSPFPPEVETGHLLGPRLTTLVAYMKGVRHCPFSTIRRYFRDVLKVRISRGQLAKTTDDTKQSSYFLS